MRRILFTEEVKKNQTDDSPPIGVFVSSDCVSDVLDVDKCRYRCSIIFFEISVLVCRSVCYDTSENYCYWLERQDIVAAAEVAFDGMY